MHKLTGPWEGTGLFFTQALGVIRNDGYKGKALLFPWYLPNVVL